jgi:hypothetical protein
LALNIEIVVELWMFIHFLLHILLGQIKSKLNYRLLTYKLASP